MREILFRGKRKDNGEWVEGYLYIKYFQELPHDRFVIEYKTENDAKMWKPKYAIAEIDPETIGQYTGITDKNGKKIFEGDIVTYKSVMRFTDDEDLSSFSEEHPEETMICIDVVKWCEKGCRFAPVPNRNDCEDYWYSTGDCDFEVIGNIHDNPELLKGGVQE